MKQSNMLHISLFVIHFLISFSETIADRPCAARQVANQSIVCVCNATYCDDITRVVPRRGQYVIYTTSAAGSRFKKSYGSFHSAGRPSSRFGGYTIELNASKTFQKIKGFGGAVTDSAAMNWKNLSEGAQENLINSYFSKSGIEYNAVRLPIAGTDFSVRYYTYDDTANDSNLTAFALQDEDYNYKIPMLKKILEVATASVLMISSYWTPPDWMKYYTETNSQCGFLKRKHYQTFANYLYKFIDSYEKEGIPIWAITTGNEPSLAQLTSLELQACLGWDNYNMGRWIVDNLGPTIRNSEYSDVNILAVDDQLYTIETMFKDMVQNNSKVLDYVDGIAVHYYSDNYVSPGVLTHVTLMYPDVFLINTEASAGFKGTHKGVLLGSWSRAETYINNILRDLTHDETGWVDWNLCLDATGGPNVLENYVDSPVIVYANETEFVKQPMFYALGHISKFIPRDSVRIATRVPACSCSIPHVAVQTPRNTIVVVLHNGGDATTVTLKEGKKEATVKLEAKSITTVEFLN